jgi:hypothetical protein
MVPTGLACAWSRSAATAHVHYNVMRDREFPGAVQKLLPVQIGGGDAAGRARE